MRARACVTGVGIVAPNGVGKDAFWNSLLQGHSGIGPVTLFDASRMKSQIAGEVKNFKLSEHVRKPVKAKRMARHTQFALASATMALDDSGLNLERRFDFPVPVLFGVSSTALDLLCKDYERIVNGSRFVRPLVSELSPQAVAAAVAKHLEIPTLVRAISSACAAGLDAIAQAAELVQSEKADVAIAGGADAAIAPIPFTYMCASGMLSTSNDHPESASRPFDLKRDSGVISEGAAVLVIENYEHAMARGARPYMEICGSASEIDPDLSMPGSGLQKTMLQALHNAGCLPDQVDYICAHGPSDPILDRVETAMIKKAFGQLAYGIPVSSIKGVTGNPLAAAGAMQVVTSALAFRDMRIPPTANYEFPDPECDLDYVPKLWRPNCMDCAVINNHGVGSGNTSMVVRSVA